MLADILINNSEHTVNIWLVDASYLTTEMTNII